MLLFGEEVFLVFGIVRRYLSALGGCFDFRRLCAYVTHPLPLSRGEILGCLFLLGSESFDGLISPLERG